MLAEKPMEVDWRFFSLRIANEDRDYDTEFPADYMRGHTRGLELLRVAAAARAQLGHDCVLPLYSALGTTIHNKGDAVAFDEPSGVERVLAELDYPLALAGAAASTEYDDVIRAETKEALDRCGGNIGTPVLSFSPPDGPSFFGPVISRAPTGREAVDLWDAVLTLGPTPISAS